MFSGRLAAEAKAGQLLYFLCPERIPPHNAFVCTSALLFLPRGPLVTSDPALLQPPLTPVGPGLLAAAVPPPRG